MFFLSPIGTSVETVLAHDLDPDTGPNGKVLYRIITGAQDKFIIGESNGLISVAPGATFDYNLQRNYTLKVDKGNYQV